MTEKCLINYYIEVREYLTLKVVGLDQVCRVLDVIHVCFILIVL